MASCWNICGNGLRLKCLDAQANAASKKAKSLLRRTWKTIRIPDYKHEASTSPALGRSWQKEAMNCMTKFQFRSDSTYGVNVFHFKSINYSCLIMFWSLRSSTPPLLQEFPHKQGTGTWVPSEHWTWICHVPPKRDQTYIASANSCWNKIISAKINESWILGDGFWKFIIWKPSSFA